MVAGPRNHLYRTPIRIRNSRPFGAGFFALRAEIDHGGDLADELDLEALVGRMQHDTLDEPAQDLQRFRLGAIAGSTPAGPAPAARARRRGCAAPGPR
jgi:hypothetical protein